jgi:aromatic ring-opening dioxygenase catalytic subunit (LigB family)
MKRFPTLFIPHGGGPCFFMETPDGMPAGLWDGMAAYLRGIGASVGERPKAVLAVSGHWEAEQPTLNAGAHPPLLFDYYGFPEHTYRLTYPAPGAPELACRAHELLANSGFTPAHETRRGFDHGVFVPFMLIYPEADIPILQLSLQRGLDAAGHLRLGRALAPLRDEGVLIVGSGMSYHNLRDLFSGRGNADAARFDAWLHETVTNPGAEARDSALSNWLQAPGARAAHPTAEHLLPLMVAAGAAGADPGIRAYSGSILGKAISGFQFGE